MPVYEVNVKWGTEIFKDVSCDTDDSPTSFKAQLFSLTGVPPDRQKVMMFGGILGDNNFDGIKLRKGGTIMLMGSADKLPDNILSAPADPIAIIKEEQKKVELPQGLINLGNTCYMNGSLQLLYSIPELKAALQIGDFSAVQESRNLLTSLQLVFQSLDKSDQAVVPALFLNALHSAFPQFATMSTSGAPGPLGIPNMPSFQQQDANECWIEIIRVLQKFTTSSEAIQKTPNLSKSMGTSGGWNPIDRYMTGHLVSTLTCTEGDEPSVESVDTFSQLSCFIDKDVKYLHTGLRNGLEGTLTKQSEALGKDAEYKKVSRISRLPGYLCVQFVRFYYKEKGQINAKILKDVKFPLKLDLYEFCTKELQTKLLPHRELCRIEGDEEALAVKSRKLSASSKDATPSDPESNPDLYTSYWFEDDLGSNNTANYELQGVLTHQGRSSSSGHYVAWVKKKNRWFKFDDDNVSEVTEEDIKKLSGGGDWHCAYILLYGPYRLKVETLLKSENSKPKEEPAESTPATPGAKQPMEN